MKNLFSVLVIMFGLFQLSTAQIEAFNFSGETTVMEFEETVFDFGTVESGEKISHIFKFKNIGDVPLVILNAKGSCGCTVPFFPKIPILPGETSEIEIAFDTKGKKGKQSKRITITANTDPFTTYLTVKGTISANEKGSTNEAAGTEIALRNKAKEDIKAFNSSCFAIYPNPANEIVQIELKEYIGQSAIIEIYNEMGQKIMDKEINSISRESTRIDVSGFSQGVYLASIRVENSKPVTQCFIVTSR